MKRNISRVLALVMVLLSFNGIALAQDDVAISGPSPETIERVYQEILTGNITNHEDVLAVAIAQRSNRIQVCFSESRDEPLQISQVLDVQTNADGVIEADIAVTSLLVLNDSGNQCSAEELVDEYYHMTTQGGHTGYQVFATHTMYTKGKADHYNIPPKREIQVARMETTITQWPGSNVTKIVHYYGEVLDPVGLHEYVEEDTINNPVPYATYSYAPKYGSIVTTPYYYGSYFQTSADIFIGSVSFTLVNYLPLDGSMLPSELEYGW